jgi:hypothetical protein
MRFLIPQNGTLSWASTYMATVRVCRCFKPLFSQSLLLHASRANRVLPIVHESSYCLCNECYTCHMKMDAPSWVHKSIFNWLHCINDFLHPHKKEHLGLQYFAVALSVNELVSPSRWCCTSLTYFYGLMLLICGSDMCTACCLDETSSFSWTQAVWKKVWTTFHSH